MAVSDTSPTSLTRVAALAVLVASIALAGVEIARIGLYGPEGRLPIVLVATAVFLPLHLWHLRYGLRGERPPRSGATLAVVAAVQVAALALVGPAWSLMLAALATSALVVLPLPWAIAALVACAAGPFAADAIRPGTDPASAGGMAYLSMSVVFRAVLQFAIVWIVATAHQLAATRVALATAAVEQERDRLEAEVRESLERRMHVLGQRGAEARRALADGGIAAPMLAIDEVVRLARGALADLRRVVAGARASDSSVAADALVRAARGARAPVRAVARVAWLPAVATHLVVFGFVLVQALELFFGDEPDAGVPVTVLGWAVLAVLFGSISWTVARGRRPRRPGLWMAALVAVLVGLQLLSVWFAIGLAWFAIAGGLMLLDGRARIGFVALALPVLMVYDLKTTLDALPGLALGALLWSELYMLAILGLVSVGLHASARMAGVLAELEASRDALAAQATHAERRRLSADLHDLLGQSLTAIALKGDLARRLVGAGDRTRAAAELEDLVALTASQADEVAAVTRDARATAFPVESENAIALLRAAGIQVKADLDLDPDGLDPEVSAALGWAIREATTNVLRHAAARRCALAVRREDAVLQLEIVNDGARGGSTPGTGLAALAERLSPLHGWVEATPLPHGEFRLRAAVPERVPA